MTCLRTKFDWELSFLKFPYKVQFVVEQYAYSLVFFYLLVITSKPKRIPVYNNVVVVVIRCDKSGILIMDG